MHVNKFVKRDTVKYKTNYNLCVYHFHLNNEEYRIIKDESIID